MFHLIKLDKPDPLQRQIIDSGHANSRVLRISKDCGFVSFA